MADYSVSLKQMIDDLSFSVLYTPKDVSDIYCRLFAREGFPENVCYIRHRQKRQMYTYFLRACFPQIQQTARRLHPFTTGEQQLKNNVGIEKEFCHLPRI